MTKNKNKNVQEEKQSLEDISPASEHAPQENNKLNAKEDVSSTSTEKVTVKPLAMYQQFTQPLIGLFINVIVLILLMVAVFYQKDIANSAIIEKQLIPLEKSYEVQKLLQKSKNSLALLLSVHDARNLKEEQQSLIHSLQKLRQIDKKNQTVYLKFTKENKSFQIDINRIQRNSDRNQQLKQSNIIQLQLILFSLEPIVKQKMVQKTLLAKQLNQDNINDRVKVNRALAYAKTLEQLQFLHQQQQMFSEILRQFEQLSIQMPLNDFDQLRDKVVAVIEINRTENTIKNKLMNEINEQIDVFESIALLDERTLAKWQGHLRLAEKFIFSLHQQNNAIIKLSVESRDIKTNNLSVIDLFLLKNNIPFAAQTLLLITLLLVVASLIFFVYLIRKLQVQIKNVSQQSVTIIEKVLVNNDSDIEANNLETFEILAKLQKIKRPKHSEKEFIAQDKVNNKQQSKLKKNEKKLKELQTNNDDMALKHLAEIDNLFTEQLVNNDTLSTMLVKAMLQSQSYSLLAGNNSNQGYRQLKRIYDWLQQQQTYRNLLTQNCVLQLEDVGLYDEIYASLLNASNLAQQQQNQIYLQLDPLLMLEAKLDVQLFNQLLILLCHIMLTEQFKATLELTLTVKDKNEGQQILHCTAMVTSTNTTTQLSELLQCLQEDEEKQQNKNISPESVCYFKKLLAKQYGSELSVQITDEGYQLSFDFPLTSVSKSQKKVAIENLKSLNILVLSGEKTVKKYIESALVLSKTKPNVLTKADNVIQQLNAKKLSKKPVDLVIVSSDIVLTDNDMILQHIDSLPTPVQPKIMVLQSGQLPVNRFGFYQQSQHPIFREQLLRSVKTLTSGEVKTNQLFNVEQCQKHQFTSTLVEVLVAVKQPAKHQTLLRLLQWLGMQVHVVSQQNTQVKQWQTGRYLVLISEFEQSPFVELNTSTSLQRGVFSLDKKWQLPESEMNHHKFKNWRNQPLPQLSDIAQITHAFSPWLKEKQRESETVVAVKKIQKKQSNEAKMSKNITEDKANKALDVAKGKAEDTQKAFDLTRYVKHQGTPELAALMLEEYLCSNAEAYSVLCSSLESSCYEKVIEALNTLLQNAKILAADEMQDLCDQLKALITEKEYKKAKKLLPKTTQQLSAIESYAESI